MVPVNGVSVGLGTVHDLNISMCIEKIRLLVISDHPIYMADNVISTCTIRKKPQAALAENALFKQGEYPFVVQVSHNDLTPYTYKVASVHIVVKQSGVVLEGASSVVDPYTGIASIDKFKLVSANNWAQIDYQIVSNGVICKEQGDILSSASDFGMSIKIATIPSVIELVGNGVAEPQVFVGVESSRVLFHVYDNNFANADGGVVTIKVFFFVKLLADPM
jgi:hypothetical protein